MSNPTFEFWLMLHFSEVENEDKNKMLENKYVSKSRRYLEKRLGEKYTVGEIIDTLKDMNLKLEQQDTYSPNYVRTDLTDDLHEQFGFRTDYEVLIEKNLKKICKQTKK